MKKKKNTLNNIFFIEKKTILIMKLTVFLFFFAIFELYSFNSFGQEIKMDLDINQKTLEEVFKDIESKSDYTFFYNVENIDLNKKVTIKVKQEALKNILERILSDYVFTVENKMIAVMSKKEKSNSLQQNTVVVTGRVLDSKTGEPLIGVTVSVKDNATTGTATDENGDFALMIPSNKNVVLVISYVGYKKQEIRVDGKKVLSIALDEDLGMLDEIVVVGYSTQKKGSVIGSIDKVNPDKLKIPTRTISTSLAGRLAGVITAQASGEPGYDGAQIWIRGINTFNGSASPLVLVDGIERNIDYLNPEEIEDFTILKDATATAVYGVRGANGVILITTKAGKIGAPRVNVRAEVGFTSPIFNTKFVDGPTYMRVHNEALRNSGRPDLYTEKQIERTESGYDPYYYPNVNWFKELITKNNPVQQVTLDASGGSEIVRYYMMAAFLNQDGMFKDFGGVSYNNNINAKRYNFRANIDLNITKTTLAGVRVAAVLQDRNYPGEATQTIFNRMMDTPPVVFPLSFPDPDYMPGYAYSQARNPYQLLARSGTTTENYVEVQSTFTLSQDLNFITKGLKLKGTFSFDSYSVGKLKKTIKPRPFMIVPWGYDENGDPILKNENGVYKYVDQDPAETSYTDNLTRSLVDGYPYLDRKIYMEANLIYSRDFGKHSVGGLLLYQQSDKQYPTSTDLYGSIPRRTQGLSGRATYSYRDTYFAEFNFGYNGSENFAKGHRYGFFPSYAIGWTPSNESFMGFIKPAVSYLKFRLSHGYVGNDNLSRFVYLSKLGSIDNTNVGFGTNNGFGFGYGNGTWFSYYGNENATWERAAKTNFGMELVLFDDIRLQADVFYEKRTQIWDQLKTFYDIFGYAGREPSANIGEMENKGFDASLEYSKSYGKDWTVDFKGTFTFARNKILKSGETPQKYPYLEKVGHSANRTLAYVAEGYFIDNAEIMNSPDQTAIGGGIPKPGDLKYKDINEDGVIDQFDRIPMKYPSVPEITYGFGIGARYKNLDISLFFQGAANVMFYARPLTFSSEGKGNFYDIVYNDYYRDELQNIDARFPRLSVGDQSANYTTSTWWMHNGNYIRLKQAEIGYNLPTSVMKKIGLRGCRIFTNANNLFTISPFKWWDPESRNMDGLKYPIQRTISFGLAVNF